MSTSWKYNCSGPAPDWVVNSDITGTGVVLSYIITAGIVVVVLLLYYLIAYDPSYDPFQGSARQHAPRAFYPNIVDKRILEASRRIAATCLGAFGCNTVTHPGFEKAFIRCIIAFSDMQLLAGYSVIISGYSQLGSGLQTFYWQAVVNLTWFSTLTHLSCLTILRNHLYLHASERTWRLAAMAILCVLLAISLGFTGNYGWSFQESNKPAFTDAAICFIQIKPPFQRAFFNMLSSILLIGFSFMVRVIKLYRFLSVDVFAKARARISRWTYTCLRIVHYWSDAAAQSPSFKCMLCYYPLLAVKLSAGLLIDAWTSVFMEICWVAFAYFWGVYRFKSTFQVVDYPTGFLDGSSDWTFGQVIAMLLLAGPLITIVESFHCDDDTGRGSYHSAGEATHELLSQDATTVQTMLPASCRSTPTLAAARHSGLLRHATWSSDHIALHSAGVYCIFMLLPILTLLAFGATGAESLPEVFIAFGEGYSYSCYLFLFAPVIGLWEVILFSLVLGDTFNKQRRWIRLTLRSLNVFFLPSLYLTYVCLLFANFVGGQLPTLAWLGISQAMLVVVYGLVATRQALLDRH
ncbi:hypothetical protein ASPBRDRAFT_46845 [Aspergillus brasiliensis CBS 101740]|uniref:Uncharacterized protein n=1 Tax=Aspergillus brasiliensis (strain CBS 101740 / IMI 381727 / IBT 21946) TaxID=767769 RepID=A0A1L9UAQ9_ASPBC|nr:hypothetical protein ASPBRDRAFT_46845 [Aspergillus brasiliensis CBS 101740]